jgi:hypothetical protein
MRLFLLIVLSLLALLTLGCKTVNTASGQKEYDPVKTEQVKAAFEPLLSSPVRRILLNSPKHAAETGTYFRGVAGVFCAMATSKQFTPEFLIAALDSLAAPKIGDRYQEVLDVKNALVAAYTIFYASRHRAELPETGYLLHISDFICSAINRALKDAGQEGVSAAIDYREMLRQKIYPADRWNSYGMALASISVQGFGSVACGER